MTDKKKELILKTSIASTVLFLLIIPLTIFASTIFIEYKDVEKIYNIAYGIMFLGIAIGII